MNITEETKQKILERIIKNREFKTRIREDEFTKTQLEYKIGRHNADNLIRSLLEENKIVARAAKTNDGKSCTAYSFVNGDWLDEILNG